MTASKALKLIPFELEEVKRLEEVNTPSVNQKIEEEQVKLRGNVNI